jgi:hypothetical protein
MEAYAYQARDPELAAYAVEVKKRALRRLGQLMAEMPKAKGAREPGTKRGTTRDKNGPASLSKRGVDKHLADDARKEARMTDDQHEKSVEDAKNLAEGAARGDKGIIRAAKERRHQERKRRRKTREQELAKKIKELPAKQYGVIVADPEWEFKTQSERGHVNTAAVNHYPVSPTDVIKSRNVASIYAGRGTGRKARS